jgi:hypothetical protein
MYAATQSSIDPSLAALLQTAQMVTPDQTPTVAAQVAQAAAQKLQPQAPGIENLLPGVQQQAMNSAQAMQPVTRGELQQMQAQGQPTMQTGIGGLPGDIASQGMAEGGVVGYAGPEGSFVGGPRRVDVSGDIPIYAPREDKERGETEAEYRARKAKEAEEAQGERPIPRGLRWIEENILRPMSQMGGQRMSEMRGVPAAQPAASPAPAAATPPAATPPANRPTTPPAPPMAPEAQRMTSQQGPRGIASAPKPPAAPAQAGPKGIATALPAIKEPGGMDRDRIETSGSAFMTQAEKDIAAAKEVEARRKEAMKSMPDLNQRGIAALEAAEQERKRLLDIERSDDSRRRWAGIFRGWGGDRDSYDRIVSGIANRDALANQAQLGFEQARIKEMQAQQARALGEFDRERALLKESAEMRNKARDDMLRAQQITAQVESGELTARTNVYESKMRAREGELNRAQNERLERIRQSTADRPGQAERIFAEYARLKGTDPKAAEQYLSTMDQILSLGKGTDDRTNLARQKLLEADTNYKMARMMYVNEKDPTKKAEFLSQMREIERLHGIQGESAAEQVPPGVTVKRVGS